MTGTTLCIVAARGGSKGVPGKNLREIAGSSLLGMAIDQGIRVFGEVLVSTEDRDIAAEARRHGGQVPFVRPPELATDTAAKVPVLQHAVNWWESNRGIDVDTVVDLSATSPLRSDDDIRGAVGLFSKSEGVENVISVALSDVSPYFNQVDMAEDGAIRLLLGGETPALSRQSSPTIYALNGAIYVWDRSALAYSDVVVRDRSVGYVMPAERSLDVDTEFDFRVAKLLLESQ